MSDKNSPTKIQRIDDLPLGLDPLSHFGTAGGKFSSESTLVFSFCWFNIGLVSHPAASCHVVMSENVRYLIGANSSDEH